MPYKDDEKRKEMLARVRPRKIRAAVMRNSARHVALLYMKMYRHRSVSLNELIELNPKMFKREGGRSLIKLSERGLVKKVGQDWQITPEGIDTVYRVVRNSPGPKLVD